jgi:hypothetical protein
VIRSPGSSEPETHCHKPRMRPAERRRSRISGRSTARAVMPTRNIQQSTRSGRNGYAGGPSGWVRPARSWSCSICISRGRRRRAATPAAQRPTIGWTSGHGSVHALPRFVPSARSGWLWRSCGERHAPHRAGLDAGTVGASGASRAASPAARQRSARGRRRARSPERRSSPPRLRRGGPSSDAVSTKAASAVAGARAVAGWTLSAGVDTGQHRQRRRRHECRGKNFLAKQGTTRPGDPGQAVHGHSRSKRSTGSTNTVAPPASTSSG